MSVVATRYAEGLYSLALDKDSVGKYLNEIDLIKESFDNSNIIELFKSYKVSKKDKKDMLDSIFKDKIDDYVLNFLDLLIDKNRIVYYDDIFKEYHKLANEHLGIKEGTIETVRPIDQTLKKQLEDSLSSDKYKVVLIEKINKDLISGFRINLDDKVIDNTMKQRIDKMEEILKRKDGN